MRKAVLILAAIFLLRTVAATTIVVGTCAHGDYEFNDIYDALREAENHWDANVWICGTKRLDSYFSLDGEDVTIGGGTIISNGDTLRINAVNVTVRDMNMNNTYLSIVAKGNVAMEDVNLSPPNGYYYCADVNAGGDFTINGVRLNNCTEGIRISGADDLNVWGLHSNEECLKILPRAVRGTIYLYPAEKIVTKTVEKIVEKNVPVETTKYVVPPEIQEKLANCEKTVAALVKKKSELENRLNELEAKAKQTNRELTETPWQNYVAIIVIGLGAGYLLGRM